MPLLQITLRGRALRELFGSLSDFFLSVPLKTLKRCLPLQLFVLLLHHQQNLIHHSLSPLIHLATTHAPHTKEDDSLELFLFYAAVCGKTSRLLSATEAKYLSKKGVLRTAPSTPRETSPSVPSAPLSLQANPLYCLP